MKREDDYSVRRVELTKLSDEELEKRFWQLTEKITKPLVELAKTHTTPSIERSVLLRMGFSSLEAQEIVGFCQKNGLLPKGAGHLVYVFSQHRKINIRDAGLMLARGDGWEEVKDLFKKGASV